MTPPFRNSVSKRELLIFLYKYRTRLSLAFIIPFTVVVALSFIPAPRYKAHSVLIVRLGSEYVYQPEFGTPANTATAVIPFNDEQIFKSEVAILNSDDLHTEVINAIGPDRLYPSLQTARQKETGQKHAAEAIELFDRHLDVSLEKESAVINVSFEHTDRMLAMKVLDTLLALYMEKRKQLYLEPRVKLAAEEAETRRKEAFAASRAVEEYKRAHKIYSLETQRAELLDERNEAQKQSVNISSSALENKIASYTHQLDQLDTEEREFGTLQREAQIAEDSVVSQFEIILDRSGINPHTSCIKI